MQMIIMNCTNDNRVINKKPSDIKTVQCQVYGECNIYAPTLVVDYDTDFTKANYAYIEEWNRYYYITDMVVRSGKRAMLTLRCDVLMSFKPQILALQCYIKKSNKPTANGNYLPDSNIPVSSDTFTVNRNFSETPFSPGSSGWYVMTVLGGGDNGS